MPAPIPDHRYTIRRKLLTILGASFHIFDTSGHTVAFCRQKALRLKEDLRFYTTPDRREELFSVRARHVIDFSATYDVLLPDGSNIGSVRRKGVSSLVRDTWQVFDADGREHASLSEDSQGLALARRFVPMVAVVSPQVFHLTRLADGARIATFKQHLNPWIYKLSVGVHTHDDVLDDLMLLAVGALISAIEGRQDDSA